MNRLYNPGRAAALRTAVALLLLGTLGASPGVDPPTRLDEADFTPLMKAASAGDYFRLLILIQDGAPLDVQSRDLQMTALMIAAWYDQFDCAQALLFNKANPDIRTRNGVTALMIAAARGNARLTQEILDFKPDVHAVSKEGTNALMLAITAGSDEVVARLLEAGAKVNYKDPNGATPLMLAASKGQGTIVKTLLDAGADRSARDKDGFTAADVARVSNHPKLIPLLKAAEEPKSKPKPKRETPRAANVVPFESEPTRAHPEDLRAQLINTPDGWTDYEVKPTGVRVALPGKPTQDDTPSDTPLGRVESHDVNLEHEGMNYYFSFQGYPASAATVDDEAFFARMVQYAMFEGTHRQAAPARRIRYGTLPGRSLRYISKDDEGAWNETMLTLVRDGRVGYVVAVNAPRGELDVEQARDYFRTLRLPEPGTVAVATPPAEPSPTVPGWTRFVSAKGGFRIDFPGPFERKLSTSDQGRTVKAERSVAGQPYCMVYEVLFDTPEEAARSYERQAGELLGDRKKPEVVESRAVVPAEGWRGVEALLRYTFQGDPPLLERKRIAFDGKTRVVTLRVNQNDDDPKALADSFFGSFALVPIGGEATTETTGPAAPLPAASWKTYRSEAFGFQVDFPAKPTADTARLPGMFESETVETDLGRVHFRVFWSVGASRTGEMSGSASFDEMAASLDARRDGVTLNKPRSSGDWKGRESVTVDDFAEPPTVERQWFLTDSGTRFVRLSVFGPKSDDTKALAERFFGSLRAEGGLGRAR